MAGDKTVEVRKLFRARPADSTCAACIAFAVDAGLDEARTILERLVASGDVKPAAGRCAGCGRPTTVYVAPTPRRP